MTRPTFDSLPDAVAEKRRAERATNWPLRKVVRHEADKSVLSCGHTVDRYVTWAARCRQCPKKEKS